MFDLYQEETWTMLTPEDAKTLAMARDAWIDDPEAKSSCEVKVDGEPYTISFVDYTTWPGYVEPQPEPKSYPAPAQVDARIAALTQEVADLKAVIANQAGKSFDSLLTEAKGD